MILSKWRHDVTAHSQVTSKTDLPVAGKFKDKIITKAMTEEGQQSNTYLGQHIDKAGTFVLFLSVLLSPC